MIRKLSGLIIYDEMAGDALADERIPCHFTFMLMYSIFSVGLIWRSLRLGRLSF